MNVSWQVTGVRQDPWAEKIVLKWKWKSKNPIKKKTDTFRQKPGVLMIKSNR